MKNKRSKGVTFWAWVFIIASVFGLLDIGINFRDQLNFGLAIYTVLSCIAYLICGIFLLQLKEPARKAAIYLGIISIIALPFLPAAMSPAFEKLYTESEKELLEQIKPEYQASALERLRKDNEAVKKIAPFMAIGIMLILEALPIYFFTRPKVKEQFT